MTIDDEKIASQLTTQWINERKKLREGLQNLCQIKTWLDQKEDKTCLEEKVLQQLKSSKPELAVYLFFLIVALVEIRFTNSVFCL